MKAIVYFVMNRLRIEEPIVMPVRLRRINHQTIDGFCRLAQEGVPFNTICDYLGISTDAFWDWMRKGQLYLESKEGGCKVCASFVLSLRRAAAEYIIKLVRDLHKPSSGEFGRWSRFMAILERRDRQTFSRYDREGLQDDSYDPDEKFL